MEKATFLEAIKDGAVLVLLDGQKLDVNPGDISYVCCWTPTTALEISEEDAGTRFFNLIVHNKGNDDKVFARWK